MNRRTIRYLTVGSVALGLGIAGTFVAYAQWSIPGQAALRVTTAAIPAGGTPTAKKQGDKVVVTWPAQEIAPGVSMQKYVVTAHDSQAPARPDVVHTVAAGTETAAFTVAELGSGRWSWAVAPKFQLWSGAEGPRSTSTVTIAAGQPTALLAAAAPATIAGSAPGTGKAATPTDPAPATATTRTTATTPVPEATSEKPKTEPTTSASEKTQEPEKTEAPKADPTHSEGPSESDSAPAS
jgi:hypothetical protein